MRSWVLFILLLIGVAGFSQQIPQNPNAVDSKNRRQGKWTIWFNRQSEPTQDIDSLDFYRIIDYKNDRPTGVTRDYYPTGELQSEMNMTADRPEETFTGTATEYRKNGTKKMSGNFSVDPPEFIFYDVNGKETSESFEKLTIQGTQLVAEGYYEMALPMLERAYTELQKGDGDDGDHAEVMAYLGICYVRMGQLSKARPILQEAVGWAGKAYGPNRPGYGRAINNLGQLYLTGGELSKAEPMFIKAKEIFAVAMTKSKGYSTYYAAILNNLALLYAEAGKFAKAEPLMVEANELYVTYPDYKQIGYPESLLNLGALYAKSGYYDKAETSYVKAKAILEKIQGNKSPLYANALVGLGSLYQVTGNYTGAENAYLEAQPIMTKYLGKDSPDNGLLLDLLAQLYRSKGDYVKAEQYYKAGIDLMEKSWGKEHFAYAAALNNLAELYYVTGRYAEAESLYKQSLIIVQKAPGKNGKEGFPTLEAATLENLGNLYVTLGNYTTAEQLYIEASASMKKIYGEAHANYAMSLHNLGQFYEMMGNYDKSLLMFQQSIDITAKALGKDHPDYAQRLNDLAMVYQNTGAYLKAEPLYREAISIAEKKLGKDHPDYSQYAENLASLCRTMARYHRAGVLYQEVRSSLQQSLGKENIRYATATRGLARVYQDMGELQKAEQLYVEAQGIVKAALGATHPIYTTTLRLMATLYDRMDNFARAKALLTEANQNDLLLIENYFPTLSESEKELFYTRLKNNFDFYNSFCVAHFREDPSLVADMFNMQLSTKALLLNSAAKWKQRIRASGDKKLFAMYSQWESNQVILAKLYKDANPNDKRMLDSLDQVTNTLEKDLSKRSELFSSITDKKRRTWQEVKGKLKPGEFAIEMIRLQKYGIVKTVRDTSAIGQPTYPNYGLTDSVYYAALVISPSSNFPELVLLKNGSELEKKYIKNYRNAIRGQIDDTESYHQFWSLLAKQLGKTLPAGKPTIYFSPDGVYNLINLNTLLNPQTSKYLIEEAAIGMVTSTKDLLITRPDETFNNLAYLFGYPDYGATEDERTKQVEQNRNALPSYYSLNIERGANLAELPATKTEVESISQLMIAKGWQANVLIGDMALEETLKDCFKPRVLHIATHGFFDSDSSHVRNPLVRSGLMLTGAGQTLKGATDQKSEDGILTAYEAMNLNLDNTDVVVLSACDTGLGDVKNGEGVYGLQRAFKVAGAKTIIMSLWSVNDEATQELMTSFYKNWLDSGNKRQAFQLAEQNLKAKYKAPYFWGAFVMLGE